MIEFCKAYKTSDGKTFSELADAQEHELKLLFTEVLAVQHLTASDIVTKADRVIDILTTTQSSRPKARKVNGGTKRRQQAQSLITNAVSKVA